MHPSKKFGASQYHVEQSLVALVEFFAPRVRLPLEADLLVGVE
jgi:hypothetical protein